jgi:carboxyl-terminal processing protease
MRPMIHRHTDQHSRRRAWPSRRIALGILLALLLSACELSAPSIPLPFALAPTPTPPPTATTTPTATPTPTTTPTATPTPTDTPTPTVTPTPTPTFVPLSPTPTLAPLAEEERTRIFEQVWALVRDRYIYQDYRGVDWEAVRAEFAPRVVAAATPEEFYDLMREMIDRLGDDHSRFESPQEVAEDEARFDGELSYVGIGAVVRDVPEGGMITRLARGGPAEEAGLQPRDVILAIDGIMFSNEEAFGPGGPITAIRGTPGSSVRLTVRSPGTPDREVEVIRRPIDNEAFPPVESRRLPGTQVGLVMIDTFDIEDLDQRVRAQIEELSKAGPLDGLIVDVRDNGGGFVDLMLDTIALFADGGSIGSSRGRDSNSGLDVPGGRTVPQLDGVPVVVLTGPDTVSAAEMFAAGMQVLGRARVVGMPSAGNTENLLQRNFSDGSRLWLAELTYQLPDGSTVEGRGVLPDRPVEAEWWRFAPEDDPQIQAALDELQQS